LICIINAAFSDSRTVVLNNEDEDEDDDEKKRKTSVEILNNSETSSNLHSGSTHMDVNAAGKGMVLPFQPLSLAFNHVSYYVDMPAVSFLPSKIICILTMKVDDTVKNVSMWVLYNDLGFSSPGNENPRL
jgi:hypothetical protein